MACRVTDAVHAAGGRIFLQLWHTAIAHPDVRGGAPPLSASDVDLLHETVTPTGRKPTVPPRPMTREEIARTVADFARAARNAEAGFDGVQILANYLYLLAQFLNRTTNRRTDEYGGRDREPRPYPLRSRRGGAGRGRARRGSA